MTYLHETTHDTIAQEQFISSESHGRDDGMIRTLTTLKCIWVFWVKNEAIATVLQRETATFRDCY